MYEEAPLDTMDGSLNLQFGGPLKDSRRCSACLLPQVVAVRVVGGRFFVLVVKGKGPIVFPIILGLLLEYSRNNL
jgi:hypothetical protein